jgi:non-heme chloroperoxidase
MKTKEVSIVNKQDKAKIVYNDWGTGQPIVFHHGWPLSADGWECHSS